VSPPTPERASEGLTRVRRGGAITELLFLYECTTDQPATLGPIARRLGLTVQAASHSFRRLQARGLVEVREGRYRPTIRGVEWLHQALGGLREDIDRRMDRLHVIRSTHAVASRPVSAGEMVSLEMHDGILLAAPGGRGPSTGRVVRATAAGGLVEIEALQGIVPIIAGRVTLVALGPRDLSDRALPRRVHRLLARERGSLLSARGLEAYHLLRQATDRPVARFAVAPSAAEAARVGLDVLILVREEELTRLIDEFPASERGSLRVSRLPRR
jgi:putative transcriptional regulator